MVHKCADLHFLCELRYAAYVIRVKVRKHQVVDFLDPSQFGRGHDPVRIAEGVIAPARIDQQRLARRRNEQSRLPALHVNEEYLQRLLGCRERRSQKGEA